MKSAARVEEPIFAGAEFATDSVKLDPDQKGWFALGDEFVEIVPTGEGKKAGSVLTYRKQRIELPHRVEAVEWNKHYCVLVGPDRLTSIQRLDAKLNVLYTREFPVNADGLKITIRLIDYRVLGTGTHSGIVSDSGTAWSWSTETTDEFWMIKTPYSRPWVPIAAGGRGYLFLGENGVAGVLDDHFDLLSIDSTAIVSSYAFVVKDRMVLLGTSRRADLVYELSGKRQTLKLKEIGSFNIIMASQNDIRQVRVGNTIILTYHSGGSNWIMEIDLDRLRTRTIETKYRYASLFIKGKDFYDSEDIEHGPVVKGEDFEKAPWYPMQKVEKKKP